MYIAVVQVGSRKHGTHSSITSGQKLQSVNSLALTPQLATTVPLRQSRFCSPPSPIQLKDFVCQFCTNVVDQLVETKCSHMICKLCRCRHLLRSPNSKPSCPVCSKQFTGLSDVQTISSGMVRIISELEIRCDNLECKVTIPLDKLQQHVTRSSPALASRVLVVSAPCESPQSTPGPSNQPSQPFTDPSHAVHTQV